MNAYVLALRNPEDLVREFRRIGVDAGGIRIMSAKGFSRLVKLTSVPSFWANILKQEMLSVGGDVAISRGSITGKARKTSCLILGNDSQMARFIEKLKRQPFRLSLTAEDIKSALENFKKDVICSIGSRRVFMGKKTYVMGILNVTPDSFSGDGIFGLSPEEGLARAQAMEKDGADILDIGGESSRPGSKRISAKEELKRLMPFLRLLTKRIHIPMSIDTAKSEVAHAALDLGVSMVNDVSALRFDKKMAKITSRYKAGLVLVHMKGCPKTMQRHPVYEDVMGEIISFLKDALHRAGEAGVSEEKIIVDPGIGFGKTLNHNLKILSQLATLKSLGRPVLVGLSRKRFLGDILGQGVWQRQWGTAAALSLAIAGGVDMVRVHDVREMKQVVSVCDAVMR